MLFLSRNTTFDDKLFYPHLGKSVKTVDEVLNHVTCASRCNDSRSSRGARDTGHVGLVVVIYSQFLYRYKQTQSAKSTVYYIFYSTIYYAEHVGRPRQLLHNYICADSNNMGKEIDNKQKRKRKREN